MSSRGTPELRRSFSTTQSLILSALAVRIGSSSFQSPNTTKLPFPPNTLALPKSTGAVVLTYTLTGVFFSELLI